MRFRTTSECQEWISAHHMEGVDSLDAAPLGVHSLYCEIPRDRLAWFSRYILESLEPFRTCLLWTGDAVWTSLDTLQLYYRVRQTYGDIRLLGEASGHEFLEHEYEDLGSFLLISLISRWDAGIYTGSTLVYVSISHDDWAEFRSRDLSRLERMREKLEIANVQGLRIVLAKC